MPKTTIVVYVEGGLVQGVFASEEEPNRELRVIVADYDKHMDPEYSVTEHEIGKLEEMDKDTAEAVAETLKEE